MRVSALRASQILGACVPHAYGLRRRNAAAPVPLVGALS
jgi:hypothetical protein